MIKKQSKTFLFLSYISIILALAIAMVLLMWGAYSIPVEKIRPNTVKSAELMNITPENPRKTYKIPGMYFDTWTDSRMLNMAAFIGQYGAFKDSLLNPRMHYESRIPNTNLAIALKRQNTDNGKVLYYPRFWHGWMIFLKPLLVFFDLAQIRSVNGLMQLTLLILILFLMYKKLGFRYCVAFLISILFLNPENSWKCLEFASDVNIMLIATLWVLLNTDPDDKYMFFIIGAIAIAFGWLAYPLITLGFPLITYILLHNRNFKDNIICVIKNSFLWFSGYALMWVSKWGIATLLTDQNTLEDGRNSIIHRTWGNWETDHINMSEITYRDTLIANLKQFLCEGSCYYIGYFIGIMLIYNVFKEPKFIKNTKALIILGIGCMPFVWYAVLMNHSIHHPWMAYKILTVTIYAFLSAYVCCLQPNAIKRKATK